MRIGCPALCVAGQTMAVPYAQAMLIEKITPEPTVESSFVMLVPRGTRTPNNAFRLRRSLGKSAARRTRSNHFLLLLVIFTTLS